jgi:hypothetical protein
LIWFWIGFFSLVALLLFIDLGLLHKENKEETFKSAVGWTIAWVTLGLSFSGVVYLIYGNHWLGARMVVNGQVASGLDAAMVYLSAYLLEEALSIDNIFVMSLLFTSFRVPPRYQHRVLFWGILGAIFFRVAMLGGGAWLVKQFTWIFYVFGAYLVWQGLKLFKGEGDDEEGGSHMERSLAVRLLRRVVRVVEGDHGGKFLVRDSHGHRAHHAGGVPVRRRADRRGVRPRLDPGGARGEPGDLHHGHLEHLRDPRPPLALLRARRRDGEVPLPQGRARDPARPHRRQDDRARLLQDAALALAGPDRRHHRRRRRRLAAHQQLRRRRLGRRGPDAGLSRSAAEAICFWGRTGSASAPGPSDRQHTVDSERPCEERRSRDDLLWRRPVGVFAVTGRSTHGRSVFRATV